MTDDGVKRLTTLKELGFLWLNHTAVTDASLEHLKALKRLGTLGIKNTQVTAKGVEAFRAAVPGCKIEWEPPKK